MLLVQTEQEDTIARVKWDMEGDQKCCVMKLRVQFGEVSPLENLGPDRIWHKQAISRSVTWMWLRVLSISEKSFSQEAAATTQDGGRMVVGIEHWVLHKKNPAPRGEEDGRIRPAAKKS